jgi:hypothetical protein
MDEKKTDELIILELFRERYKDFPKGDLSVSESPDFILSLGPRNKIGLELTRFHQQFSGGDPFSYENISACLNHKEDKLRLYRRKKLREYWLILAVLDPAYKSSYNLHNKLLVWKFETGYNRIFIFNVLNGDVFRLKRHGKS